MKEKSQLEIDITTIRSRIAEISEDARNYDRNLQYIIAKLNSLMNDCKRLEILLEKFAAESDVLIV